MARRRKRERQATGLLAIFGGFLGLHRFYLGQVGLGILYIFLPGAWLISIIDALIFLNQDDEKFDYKYNRELLGISYKEYDTDYERGSRKERRKEKRKVRQDERTNQRTAKSSNSFPQPKAKKNHNVHKLNGITKYRDFDFLGAIEDFKKALQVEYKDIAVHFNLACAYSISEEADSALFHLDKAVEYGFVDFKKIKDHDALAFLRIQDEFEKFAKNGYRLHEQVQPQEDTYTVQNIIPESNDLLEQLRKLGELKEKGLLTEEEFITQKSKLLR